MSQNINFFLRKKPNNPVCKWEMLTVVHLARMHRERQAEVSCCWIEKPKTKPKPKNNEQKKGKSPCHVASALFCFPAAVLLCVGLSERGAGMHHEELSCPPHGQRGARGPSSRSGVRWLIPPFRRRNAFWSKEQIKDFNDWQRFMPLLFLIPWLLTF